MKSKIPPAKLLMFPMYSLYYIDDASSDAAIDELDLAFVLGAMGEKPGGKEIILEAMDIALADREFDFTTVLPGLWHSNEEIRNWLGRLSRRLGGE